jgi:hypothetical protein
VLPLLVSGAAACSWVPTPFQRMAADTASTFSSAAETLRLEHPDESGATRLTREYAEAAFQNYAEQISGVAGDLPKAGGAPDPELSAALVRLVETGTQIVGAPCLDPGCDWQVQIQQLELARDALLEVSG